MKTFEVIAPTGSFCTVTADGFYKKENTVVFYVGWIFVRNVALFSNPVSVVEVRVFEQYPVES